MLKDYFETLNISGLFKGVSPAELENLLECLGFEIRQAGKDEIILLAGNKPKHLGIVLSGRLHIIQEDYNGNRVLMAAISAGEIFAEALCCADVDESPVTVVADSASVVLLLSFSHMLQTCPKSCVFHSRLIENMLRLIANKNLLLQSRMEIISLKTIRAKVTRYFMMLQAKQGKEITIPFNREELADFLCVERTALSHELAHMKKDGLIDYKKNRFIINSSIGQGNTVYFS